MSISKTEETRRREGQKKKREKRTARTTNDSPTPHAHGNNTSQAVSAHPDSRGKKYARVGREKTTQRQQKALVGESRFQTIDALRETAHGAMLPRLPPPVLDSRTIVSKYNTLSLSLSTSRLLPIALRGRRFLGLSLAPRGSPLGLAR